jgi:hypothetical protein
VFPSKFQATPTREYPGEKPGALPSAGCMVANEQVFYRYVELHGGIGTNMERTELVCSSGQQQQQQRLATTMRCRHSPQTRCKGCQRIKPPKHQQRRCQQLDRTRYREA